MNGSHPEAPAPSAPAPVGAATATVKPEQPPISAYDPRYKSPLVASFLSIFPGLGQVYVGYYRLGFTNVIIVASLITMLASRMDDTFRPLLGVFLAFFWLYNMIDAGRRAALYNHALRSGQSFEIPTTPSIPGGVGSMAGGVALIVIGLLFLMHTAFHFSLAWIEDWWPLAPIAFGFYLVYRSIEDRAASRAHGSGS